MKHRRLSMETLDNRELLTSLAGDLDPGEAAAADPQTYLKCKDFTIESIATENLTSNAATAADERSSHQYMTGGIFEITVTINDGDGSAGEPSRS